MRPCDGKREPSGDRPGAFMERQIGHLLRRAYFVARNHSAEALRPLGNVSPVQASALAALMAGPMSQAELGRTIDMEAANTHALVRRLAAAGLAETFSSPVNARLSLVTLTELGADLAEQLETLLASAAATTLASLDHLEREQLITLLRRILEFAE